jgi:hypothetical protein
MIEVSVLDNLFAIEILTDGLPQGEADAGPGGDHLINTRRTRTL